MAVVQQDSRERIAVGGVPPAGRDQDGGRVGGYEFQQDPLGRRGAAAAEALSGLEHAPQGRAMPFVGEDQVQETRAGDVERDQRVTERLGERLAERLRHLTRRGPQGGRQQHRGVGGVVALIGPLGPLEL